MLPGTGTTELSRSPNKISPGPPKCRSQRNKALPAAGFAAANKASDNNQISIQGQCCGPARRYAQIVFFAEVHGDTRIPVENKRMSWRLTDGNRLLIFAVRVPAGRVPEMREQRVDAGLRLRVAKIKFRPAIFPGDGVSGAHLQHLDRIVARRVRQPISRGDVIARVYEDQRTSHPDRNPFQDFQYFIHRFDSPPLAHEPSARYRTPLLSTLSRPEGREPTAIYTKSALAGNLFYRRPIPWRNLCISQK
jgi:hypothetical protein